MKKFVCTLTLSALFGLGAAMAAPQPQDQAPPPQQNGPDGGGHWNGGQRQMDPNRQVQMLTKRLNLNSDQQSKILPVLQNRNQQMESLRSDNSLSREDRQAKMRAIREDSDTQIRAVLNDKQKKTYDQMQQEMRDRQQQRREQQQNQPQNQ
jgi:hypothetical protein